MRDLAKDFGVFLSLTILRDNPLQTGTHTIHTSIFQVLNTEIHPHIRRMMCKCSCILRTHTHIHTHWVVFLEIKQCSDEVVGFCFFFVQTP